MEALDRLAEEPWRWPEFVNELAAKLPLLILEWAEEAEGELREKLIGFVAKYRDALREVEKYARWVSQAKVP